MIKKLIFKIQTEIRMLLECIILYFPGTLGEYFRKVYYRRILKSKIGKNPQIGFGTQIYPEPGVSIGENFVTGPFVHIIPHHSFGIRIGDNVSIAHGSFLRGANHQYFKLNLPIQKQGHFAKKILTNDGKCASIIIEDDVIIGAYSIILTGAYIRKGSVIAAGSVISSEIPENSIVIGNPARVVANRTKLTFNQGIVEFS